MRHHVGGALCHARQHCRIGMRVVVALRVKVLNHIVGQCLKLFVLLAVRKMLEVAKAHKTLRHPGHHRGGFAFLPPHCGVRAGQAQRAGGRYAQGVHCLAAQKFADRAPQHRPAIASPRKRRRSSTLELHFQALEFAQ